MSLKNELPWNVEIEIGGVTFEGPGMETQAEARSVKSIVERKDDVQRVEVIRQ